MKITDVKAALYVLTYLMLGMGTAAIAHAEGVVGLLIEPALTYESSSLKTNFPAPLSDSTGFAKGVGIGARVGFQFADVFFCRD